MTTLKEKCQFAKKIDNLIRTFVNSKLKHSNCWNEPVYLSNDGNDIIFEWESDMTGYGGSTETHFTHYPISEFEEYLKVNDISI